jgi:hypothetical protein
MNLDPFGHIAVARHFQNEGRRELAACRTPEGKKAWLNYVERIDSRIKKMEASEIEFWETMW